MGYPQLRPDDLPRLAGLEQRVLHADGVRLKLEWPTIREHGTVAALTQFAGPDLVGFVGLYRFGPPSEVELTGMVDPSHRGRGIADSLLDRALEICAAEQLSRSLLVVPRRSGAGRAMARARGAALEHSEYSLLLTHRPPSTAEDPRISLRPADATDRPALLRILAAGFGPPPEGRVMRLHGEGFRTLMIEAQGRPVGTLRLSLHSGEGAIHAFTVDPAHRGRGIGRDVLTRACGLLRESGAARVGLEVAVENDGAIGLYTSIGFAPVSTEDYYLLP